MSFPGWRALSSRNDTAVSKSRRKSPISEIPEYVFAVGVTVLERVLDAFDEVFVGFDDVRDDTVERTVAERFGVPEDLCRHQVCSHFLLVLRVNKYCGVVCYNTLLPRTYLRSVVDGSVEADSCPTHGFGGGS